MTELAAELGHSVIFPTDCRYCGRLIYLFSSPEGGFAIFDDVGIPWPKHECWGVRRGGTDYRGNRFYSEHYRVPISRDREGIRSPENGPFTGICLGSKGDVDEFSYLFWNGSGVFNVCSNDSPQFGRLYQGVLKAVSDRYWLEDSILIEYVNEDISNLQFTECDWENADEVWCLQQDSAALLPFEGEIKNLLLAAIDGIVTENEIISSMALLQLTRICSFSLPQSKKQFYEDLAIQILEASGFEYHPKWRPVQDRDSLHGAMQHIDSLICDSSLFIAEIIERYEISLENLRSTLDNRVTMIDYQLSSD